MNETEKELLETINSLVQKGLLKIDKVHEDGNFDTSLTPLGEEIGKEAQKRVKDRNDRLSER